MCVFAVQLSKEERLKALDKAAKVCDRVLDRVILWAVELAVDPLGHFKMLRTLDLRGCIQLTDYGIIECVRSFPVLQVC